ncbi:MAG TPA: DUF2064 domain-containing protein [Acidimicrobiales bacterium]|nr:DUF2064 domain-containing protein [Acidimicrobiales bacterium]
MRSRRSTHLLVMAKAPVPGQVKTRLIPSFGAQGAAAIARAALCDTLDAVDACAATRRIVAVAGAPLPTGVGAGCEVLAQRGETFNDRLAAAWAHAGAPGLQIGMDTPQVTPALLDAALAQLVDGPDDAVLGLATDGGWWAIGFRRPIPGAFAGVPMSADDTGARQLARLRALGVRVGLLPELRDMDRPEDVAAIAADHPHLRVAREAAIRADRVRA